MYVMRNNFDSKITFKINMLQIQDWIWNKFYISVTVL